MDLTTILAFFASPAALVPLIVLVGEFVDKYWDLDGTAAYIRTAVLAVLLGLVGLLFNIGYMADVGGVEIVYNLVVLILASTGLFAVPFLKQILEFLKIRKPPSDGGSG